MGKVKVIKDNDGVAVVEGTPAASLIKDSEKLFNAPMPERKAGQKLVQRNLADVQREADLQKAMEDAEVMKATPKLVSRDLSAERDQQSREAPPGYMTNLQESEQEEADAARRALATNVKEKPPQETEPKRQEAVNRTREYKRQRFIERSAGEQAATQGSFITTLQT